MQEMQHPQDTKPTNAKIKKQREGRERGVYTPDNWYVRHIWHTKKN